MEKNIYGRNLGLNKDKIFYVIERNIHTSGLFSNYIFVIQQISYALQKGYYPIVDYKNFMNFYLDKDKIGIENSWEYYFEQPIDITLDEVYKSKNVIFSMDKDLQFEYIDCIINDKEKRNFYKEISKKYIKLNEKCEETINYEYKKVFQELVRCAGGYIGEQIIKIRNHIIIKYNFQ